jgi:phosphatidate cytidylyltransferase
MLKYRLITGPLLLLALLGVVILDDALDRVELGGFVKDLFLGREHPPRGLVLFAAGLVFAALGAKELTSIFNASGVRAKAWLTAAAAIVGLFLSYAVRLETPAIRAIAIVGTGLIVILVVSLLVFSRQHNVQGVLAAAGATMFAAVYLGLMFGFLVAIRREHSAWLVVGIVLTTKACDSGAYFTGRLIGRHKLIPWLSPGKTWEGLVGGIIAATLVGWGLAALSREFLDPVDHVPAHFGAIAGFAFAIVGQFGDLTVSLFKRGAGVKDSSNLLPGLGGVLDVLDSPLMVAPVAFWMIELWLEPRALTGLG